MAELAHDVSGPASSEAVGIAAQQASEPASSDRGKLRVFISYSRDDLKFADQLDAALDMYGFECFIELVGELQVVAAVGNKDAELPSVGRGGLARLLRGDANGLRRSWTGCVMRKVCHSTALMRAD